MALVRADLMPVFSPKATSKFLRKNGVHAFTYARAPVSCRVALQEVPEFCGCKPAAKGSTVGGKGAPV
jgi:hypothetical protein